MLHLYYQWDTLSILNIEWIGSLPIGLNKKSRPQPAFLFLESDAGVYVCY